MNGTDELRIVNAADVHLLMEHIDAVASMRTALMAIASDHVSAPPRVSAYASDGKLTAMPSYVDQHGLSCKLMAVFPGMTPHTHSGAIALFDGADGRLLALVDAGLVTAVRTAAVTAVATDALARRESNVLAILGGGTQGQAHLQALRSVRPWSRIIVANRSQRGLDALHAIDERVEVARSAERAVEAADVVAACTSSPTPLVHREWVRPGTHVSSVGGGHELDPLLIEQAHLFVEWYGAAQYPSPAGAQELQNVDPARLTLVGAVLSGTGPGRTAADELTVYKATGLGAEDTVLARALYRQAVEQGVGQVVAWPRGHQ